jgi:nucleoporin SEH1
MVGWGVGQVRKHGRRSLGGGDGGEEVGGGKGKGVEGVPKSGLKAGLDQLKTGAEKRAPPAQIKHVVAEISRLDIHRTPVWRVGFDDDGHILGSVGDEGRLICYRQKPDGTWGKSSENSVLRMKMAAPTA